VTRPARRAAKDAGSLHGKNKLAVGGGVAGLHRLPALVIVNQGRFFHDALLQ
jgi:hypothetical protein